MKEPGLILKKILVCSCVALITVACGSVSEPEKAINKLESVKGIKEIQADSIAAVLRYFPNNTEFSISLLDSNSQAIYIGVTRENDTLKNVQNKDMIFEIGSISKVFTSTLLTQLVLDSTISLNESIVPFLETPLNDSTQITFRQLANHTSGLPRVPLEFIWENILHMENPYRSIDEQRLKEYLKSELSIMSDKDTTYRYSNIGAGLLGYTLTKVTGLSYEEMIQRMIFKPLGMRNSTTNRNLVENKLIKGLNKRGKTTSNWDMGALKGAGGILSSAEDVTKFVRYSLRDSSLVNELQQKKTFTVNDNMDIALGWFIIRNTDGSKWLWHNGGTGGYRSSLVVDKTKGTGVVVLSNISSGHEHAGKIDQLAFYLTETLGRE